MYKNLIFKTNFDEKWTATISFGENTAGTIVIPWYDQINGYYHKVAIYLQAVEVNKIGISSHNEIPLLIYKKDEKGELIDFNSLHLGQATDVSEEHWVSTQAIDPNTKLLTTVTFNLKRGTDREFTLTLLDE